MPILSILDSKTPANFSPCPAPIFNFTPPPTPTPHTFHFPVPPLPNHLSTRPLLHLLLLLSPFPIIHPPHPSDIPAPLTPVTPPPNTHTHTHTLFFTPPSSFTLSTRNPTFVILAKLCVLILERVASPAPCSHFVCILFFSFVSDPGQFFHRRRTERTPPHLYRRTAVGARKTKNTQTNDRE